MEAPRSRLWEILVNVFLLSGGVLLFHLNRWRLAEACFLLLVAQTSIFALRRFALRRDNPPPGFVLVAFGLLFAFVGGLFLLWPPSGFVRLGRNLLEQGVFLAFVMAVGSYLGPRLLHRDLDYPATRGPEFRRKLRSYLLAGLLLLLSFSIESGTSLFWGRLLRALVVTTYLFVVLRIHWLPDRPLWHLYFLWFAFFCLGAGQWMAAFLPAYEIASLHVTFIGGFGLTTLMIAARVTAAHCGFERVWEKNTWAVGLVGTFSILALFARMSVHMFPERSLAWLHAAAGFWLLGIVVWGIYFAPKLTPGNVSPDD